MVCDKEKNKKTAVNNQWVGTASVGKASDYQDKTEFSNEWVSTNKMATSTNVAATSTNVGVTEENFNEK